MTETQRISDISFADRLKQLRKERGLSQDGLGKATSIDQAIISRYENGLIPQIEHITRLAGFFGVDLSQFTTEPGDPIVNEIAELVLRLPRPKQVEVLEFTRFKNIAA